MAWLPLLFYSGVEVWALERADAGGLGRTCANLQPVCWSGLSRGRDVWRRTRGRRRENSGRGGVSLSWAGGCCGNSRHQCIGVQARHAHVRGLRVLINTQTMKNILYLLFYDVYADGVKKQEILLKLYNSPISFTYKYNLILDYK